MTITAYKGMDKNMQCRGFQYEVGGTYETDKVKCCEKGFHACETPLDVLKYYPPADSRYFEVEQSGEISRMPDDSKVASSKLTVKAEIGLPGLIKAQIEWVKTKRECAAASGERGNAAASGWSGNAAASGERGNAAASGESGNAAASGERGTAVVSGTYGTASATGEQSLAVAWGYGCKAKGAVGSWLVLTEYSDTKIQTAKMVEIDGKRYKADTWYKLVDGKIVEAE